MWLPASCLALVNCLFPGLTTLCPKLFILIVDHNWALEGSWRRLGILTFPMLIRALIWLINPELDTMLGPAIKLKFTLQNVNSLEDFNILLPSFTDSLGYQCLDHPISFDHPEVMGISGMRVCWVGHPLCRFLYYLVFPGPPTLG
jgi:hypothetical protein